MAFLAGRTIDMGNGAVAKVLFSLALPSMASMLFHTLYTLIDTVFIAWLGEAPMAAMALLFPAVFAVFALTNGIGTGMTSLVTQHRGAGRADEAKNYGAARWL